MYIGHFRLFTFTIYSLSLPRKKLKSDGSFSTPVFQSEPSNFLEIFTIFVMNSNPNLRLAQSRMKFGTARSFISTLSASFIIPLLRLSGVYSIAKYLQLSWTAPGVFLAQQFNSFCSYISSPKDRVQSITVLLCSSRSQPTPRKNAYLLDINGRSLMTCPILAFLDTVFSSLEYFMKGTNLQNRSIWVTTATNISMGTLRGDSMSTPMLSSSSSILELTLTPSVSPRKCQFLLWITEQQQSIRFCSLTILARMGSLPGSVGPFVSQCFIRRLARLLALSSSWLQKYCRQTQSIPTQGSGTISSWATGDGFFAGGKCCQTFSSTWSIWAIQFYTSCRKCSANCVSPEAQLMWECFGCAMEASKAMASFLASSRS